MVKATVEAVDGQVRISFATLAETFVYAVSPDEARQFCDILAEQADVAPHQESRYQRALAQYLEGLAALEEQANQVRKGRRRGSFRPSWDKKN